jgi:uncharacterized protein involved in exopolysaccharide biosynthesis
MKRWLKLAIWLYPCAWRARYAREVDALLDDMRPRGRDVWDMLRGAITMQLSTPVTYFRLGAATALLGALVAGGVTFALPKRYVSSAVMRMSPQVPEGDDSAQYQILASERLNVLQQEVLSRSSLAELIQNPSVDLYRDDRRLYPMEDIIQNMRQHDIRIVLEEPRIPFAGSAFAFEISFEYPDREKTQRVVQLLVSKFTGNNVRASQSAMAKVDPPRADNAQPSAPVHPEFLSAGSETPAPSTKLAGQKVAALEPPIPVNLELLDPASYPDKAVDGNRLGIIGIGFGAGFALGLLLVLLRRRPLRWTLWMAGATIIGFAGFFAMAMAQDLDPVPFGSFGAAGAIAVTAYLLRDRAAWQPVPYVRFALAAAICGAIVAGLGSFAVRERYVSSASFRIYQRNAAGGAGPDLNGAVAERYRQLRIEMLSRASLAELIQRPPVDLYRQERRRLPLEEVIQKMRRDIQLPAASPAVAAYHISFEYPDRFKAQAVVRELITKVTEGNAYRERTLNRERGQPGSIATEVLDPASDPQTPVGPDRLRFAAIGFGAGLPIGLLVAYVRRRPPGQALAMLRFAAASGAAGTIVAAVIAFAIPSRYVATATLCLHVPEDRETPDRRITDYIQQRMMEVLSRRNLGELIASQELNLYGSERQRHSLMEVADEMRERDLRIESVDVGLRSGGTTAFTIAFEYSDPEKARAMVQAIVSKFVEGSVAPTFLEVLDPPSIAGAPVFPQRLPIAAIGLAAGLLLGPVLEALSRRRPWVTA